MEKDGIRWWRNVEELDARESRPTVMAHVEAEWRTTSGMVFGVDERGHLSIRVRVDGSDSRRFVRSVTVFAVDRQINCMSHPRELFVVHRDEDQLPRSIGRAGQI